MRQKKRQRERERWAPCQTPAAPPPAPALNSTTQAGACKLSYPSLGWRCFSYLRDGPAGWIYFLFLFCCSGQGSRLKPGLASSAAACLQLLQSLPCTTRPPPPPPGAPLLPCWTQQQHACPKAPAYRCWLGSPPPSSTHRGAQGAPKKPLTLLHF